MFRFTASDGVSIAREQWGQENAGTPVFLWTHGYGINVQMNWITPGVVKALVEPTDTSSLFTRVVTVNPTSRTTPDFMAKTGWRSTCPN
jgi:hypothetical protein